MTFYLTILTLYHEIVRKLQLSFIFYSVVEQASIREISISRYAQLHILTSMDWEICILLISMWGKPPPGTSSKSSSYRSKRSVASMPTLIVPWMKTDKMMSKRNIRTNSVTLNVQGFFIFLGFVQINVIMYVCTEQTQRRAALMTYFCRLTQKSASDLFCFVHHHNLHKLNQTEFWNLNTIGRNKVNEWHHGCLTTT